MIGAAPELGLALVASTAQWTRRLANKLEMLTQRRVEELPRLPARPTMVDVAAKAVLVRDRAGNQRYAR